MDKPKELSQARVEQEIALADGMFASRDLCETIGIVSPEGKTNLRQILRRLKEKGVIHSTGRDGVWRKADHELEPIEWRTALLGNTLPLLFPFEIEKYARIIPGSIIIVTGDKNAGKTAFCNKFCALNSPMFEIDLFNSEMAGCLLRERLDPLNIPEDAPFHVWSRANAFADVMNSEHITVIDYLDLDSEHYLVAVEINEIFQKVKMSKYGAALIALQKPPATVAYVKGVKKVIDRDLAYGAGSTAKRAFLYVTMTGGENGRGGKLKLKYVKAPVKTNVNPNNMTWTYELDDNGVEFVNIQRFYETIAEY